MDLKIVVPGNKPVRLDSLKLGTRFCFVDSRVTSENIFPALQNIGENIFFVYEEERPKAGEVDIVSLDGQQTKRRMGSRQVIVTGDILFFNGEKSEAKARISNVAPGGFVFYDKDPARASKLLEARLHFVVKGNPTPDGKAMLISSFGEKAIVDDDLLVHTYDGTHTIVLTPKK